MTHGRNLNTVVRTTRSFANYKLTVTPRAGISISTAIMSNPLAFEQQVAIAAVRRACVLTNSVFNKLVKNETVTKDDKSPVTGGQIGRTIL